ncbi:hypothetical protein P4B35_03760 [Pontiellaceae bacterium B12227]|nr:hypothetical protein [Pontiellaceae bacterium B12227]
MKNIILAISLISLVGCKSTQIQKGQFESNPKTNTLLVEPDIPSKDSLMSGTQLEARDPETIKTENPNSPDEKGTRQYQKEFVSKGMPAIPILLTRKEIDQLIKDGELSPRSEWE